MALVPLRISMTTWNLNRGVCHAKRLEEWGEWGAESREAELTQELSVILEEDPEHLGDGEDDLAGGDIKQELLPHPGFSGESWPAAFERSTAKAGPARGQRMRPIHNAGK
jgi:hypothetical protein